ncbi:potassium channel family protein [Dermatobacter hominis]|uniref:potassium channel family protein n=1 Tax=Dermatobacter hominis TaxID=2884263 RepID=UPI001D12C56A|nr:potassium channel family protein [Dermatobacter hominis]UDY34714.1 potassium channel family protein [Dermatobacter hominis]
MASDPDGPAQPVPARFPRLRRFVQPSEQKSIAPVLGLTLLAMLLSPFLSNYNWSRALEVALIGVSAIVALARTGAHPAVRRTGTAIVVLATLAGATIPVVHDASTGTVEVLAAGLFALLLLVTPMLVMVRLMLRPRITVDTLAGALTAYLQIGIFFGALYLFIALVGGPSDFFAQTTSPAYSDFEYFSFITMTTVGYGDLTPATRLGQTLATIEAVTGQVFLVTVVALTVSNLGRPTRRGDPAGGGPDAPPDPAA